MLDGIRIIEFEALGPAPFAGMLIGRRHPARVDIGDTFAVLAVKR